MSREYHQCLAVYVAVFLVLFPPTFGASVTISTASSNPLKVEYTTDNKNAVFKWSWTSQNVTLYKIHIKRWRLNLDKKEIAYYDVSSKNYGPPGYDSYFKLVVIPGSGGTGTVELTIPDVINQGTDSDGSAVDVLKHDYKYECTIINTGPEANNQVTLKVDAKPRITTLPQSYESSEKEKRFKMRCIATGKPLPSIAWLVTRINGQEHSRTGTKITGLESFRYGSEIPVNSINADTGVYKCTAKNRLGQDSAQATFVYTGCSVGCSFKDDIAILMTKLNYSSINSTKLKQDIETECVHLYAKESVSKIYSCVVRRFRPGSVIVVINITYPEATRDPEGPLKAAIKDGKFAGYDVATSLVSPSSHKPEELQIVNAKHGELDVNKGHPINITCKATGNPPPYYHWTHNGTSRDSPVNNTIIISRAALGDAGEYVCTAWNKLGTSKITVTLRVKYQSMTCVEERKRHTEEFLRCPESIVLGVFWVCSLVFNILLIVYIVHRTVPRAPPRDRQGNLYYRNTKIKKRLDQKNVQR